MLHHHPKSTRLRLRAKNFRLLFQEERELWNQKRQAPLVELKEPFVRGSERFFVLTDQAKLRSDADKLTFVLDYFQNHQCCRKGLFRSNNPLGRRWAKNEIGKHYLRRPTLHDLVKKSLPRALYPYLKAQSLDFLDPIPPFRRLKTHQKFEKLRFRYPKLVKTHTQPRIITHLPLHDPALEARLQELDTILWESGRRGEVNKALHFRKWREFKLSPIEKSLRENYRHQLQEANSDPTIKSAISSRFFCAFFLSASSIDN